MRERSAAAPRVSAVVNTRNEAHHLQACVDSVRQVADEVVVCDMESTDGSAAIGREMGCKVISHRWMPAPEPEARLAAIAAASGEWVLVFDPDMRISGQTGRRLREIVEKDECDAVDFYMDNHFFGVRCPHGHGSEPVFRKMFKKAALRPISRNIQTFWHESVSGRVLRLGREHAITHLSYETVDECVETLMRYAVREAEQASEAGIRASAARMLARPVRRFVKNYLLLGGFLDGKPGLVINVMASWYVFLSEARLWDLERAAARGPDRSPPRRPGVAM